jgi:hypothetical protein
MPRSGFGLGGASCFFLKHIYIMWYNINPMTKKDLNTIAKIEKAVSQRWGDEAIINPKSKWDEEKEKEYLEQIKNSEKKNRKYLDSKEKVEKDGFLISKKLLNKDNNRKCPVCEVYSFDIKDDLYMVKFECCYSCYMKYVSDGREERWKSGWRPNNEDNKV